MGSNHYAGDYCYIDWRDCFYVRQRLTYDEEPEVKEYLVDASIMDELESVIYKYKMNRWNKKKFTDMFVSDGASMSYGFSFDKSYVSFSSQIYPMEYGEKLKEFDEIISKYIESTVEIEYK